MEKELAGPGGTGHQAQGDSPNTAACKLDTADQHGSPTVQLSQRSQRNKLVGRTSGAFAMPSEEACSLDQHAASVGSPPSSQPASLRLIWSIHLLSSKHFEAFIGKDQRRLSLSLSYLRSRFRPVASLLQTMTLTFVPSLVNEAVNSNSV